MSIQKEVNVVSSKKNVIIGHLFGAALIGLLAIIGVIIYQEFNSGSFVLSDIQSSYSSASIGISEKPDFESALATLDVDSSLDRIGIT